MKKNVKKTLEKPLKMFKLHDRAMYDLAIAQIVRLLLTQALKKSRKQIIICYGLGQPKKTSQLSFNFTTFFDNDLG